MPILSAGLLCRWTISLYDDDDDDIKVQTALNVLNKLSFLYILYCHISSYLCEKGVSYCIVF